MTTLNAPAPRASRFAALPAAGPRLPARRGPLSARMVALLRGRNGDRIGPAADGAASFGGDDLQLALYLAYELHYRGFVGIPDEREWDPNVLALRDALEGHFLRALRAELGPMGTMSTLPSSTC